MEVIGPDSCAQAGADGRLAEGTAPICFASSGWSFGQAHQTRKAAAAAANTRNAVTSIVSARMIPKPGRLFDTSNCAASYRTIVLASAPPSPCDPAGPPI